MTNVSDMEADVAQVQNHHIQSFGSGRLIADNLVLTAEHVLYKYSESGEILVGPCQTDWQVRLYSDRVSQDDWRFRVGNTVVWYDRKLDLALIELRDEHAQPINPPLRPRLHIRVAAIEAPRSHDVEARGFPRASIEGEGWRKLTLAKGELDRVGDELFLVIRPGDRPNCPPNDWPGMSGSSVISAAWSDPTIAWIYGVVRKVPAHFDGKLGVASLAAAWRAPGSEFRARLVAAGVPDEVAVEPEPDVFSAWRTYLDLQGGMLDEEVQMVCRGLKPAASPLLPYVERLAQAEGWNVRVREAFKNIVYESTDKRVDLATTPEVGQFLDACQELLEAINFSAGFDQIEGALRGGVTELIANARRLRCNGVTGTERLARVIRQLQDFTRTWLDRGSFGVCMVVLGNFGSGRTFLVLTLIRKNLNTRSDEAAVWPVRLEHPDADVTAEDWILQATSKASGRQWRSLDQLDAYMAARKRRVILVIDDFERLVQRRPAVAAEVRLLISRNTRFSSLRWLLLAQDTSYDALEAYTDFFRRYSIAPLDQEEWRNDRESASFFIDGAFMAEIMNRNAELGLTVIAENVADKEVWDRTLENLDSPTRIRLSSPLLAAVAVQLAPNGSGVLPTLHFNDFVDRLWKLRTIARLEGASPLRIERMMLALSHLILEMGTLTPLPTVVEAKLAKTTGGGLDDLHILAQLSFIRLPRASPIMQQPDIETIQLEFDIIWQSMMARQIAASLPNDATAEQHVMTWMNAIPDPAFKEGVWQFFLLQTDFLSKADRRASCREGRRDWWKFALRSLFAEEPGPAPLPGIPVAAALFAGVHASADSAAAIAGHLVAYGSVLQAKRDIFAALYFSFFANGVRFANRCKIVARLAANILECDLQRYLRFQLAQAVDLEDAVQPLVAGLHTLSGIEILPNGRDMVDSVCSRILEIIDAQARENSRVFSETFKMTIVYLQQEAGIAAEEYGRVGSKKPAGVPYFVREHALHFFLDHMLHEQHSAVEAFDAFMDAQWYKETREDLHRRILAEMRREANLAFGRWYRWTRAKGYERQSQTYHELVWSLVKKARTGDQQSGEIAFFLLRHSVDPHDHDDPDADRSAAMRFIDDEFAQSLSDLKVCTSVQELFRRYPTRIRAERIASVGTE